MFSSPATHAGDRLPATRARSRDASSTRSRRRPGTSAKPPTPHGLRFVGHEPLRPLLDHRAPLDAWTVPVAGRDTHQVAVGPIHAGVIESGHFRFHVVGERILHLDVQLFYKRRGLEAAAAGRPLSDAIAYAQRACGACAVANTVAYAHACEAALGLHPDDQLRRGRTLLLELERVYNHLHDISAICAGVGFAPGTMAYATLKERAQRLNLRLTGHRFLFGHGQRRRQRAVARPAARSTMRARELRELGEEHATIWRQLQFVVLAAEPSRRGRDAHPPGRRAARCRRSRGARRRPARGRAHR